MIKCANCGQENNPGSTFCAFCGFNINPEAETVQTGPNPPISQSGPQPQQPTQTIPPPSYTPTPSRPLSQTPPPATGAPASSNATIILLLGIGGLVLCPILGPVAWILGNSERAKVNRGEVQPNGMITAGWVMGIIATAFMALWLMLVFVGALSEM